VTEARKALEEGDERGRGHLVPLAVETSLRTRLIAREERALVELIDLASPWLLGLAQSMVSDQTEAEEIVFDAFRIAWEKIGTLPVDQDQRLLPWLFRVVRNRAIDRLRARRRQRSKLELVAQDLGIEAVAVPLEPNEAAQPGWHVHRTVHRAIDLLPADQRLAIELAYFRGLTQSEIAERLGIPLGTVKTRLRLAFDKLRGALAPLKEWLA
jgi:RNA polymerase sigma-70 factor (ECF subfamily)